MLPQRGEGEAIEAPPSPAGDAAPASTIADGEFHRLDPRSVPLERVGGWIFTAVVSGGGLVALIIMFFSEAVLLAMLIVGGVWLLLTALLVWLTLVYPGKWYQHAQYRVDGSGIEIHKGVWWRSVINVAKTRIQHTDVAQGPLARHFGIAKLVIHTAGTEHHSVELPGLARETALALRDHLAEKGDDDDGV